MINRIQYLAAFLLSLLLSPSRADDVTVAVAANFMAPMQALVVPFSRATGHTVTLSSGASGHFYAQIRNGAPFQVLLSADQDKPALLERDGLVVAGSRFTYAIGKLALWSPDPGRVDPEGLVLTQHRFTRLALANPDLAPYGHAAMQVLDALHLRTGLQDHIVMGDNLAQTYLFVASGHADLGFVALSQIAHNGQLRDGSVWIVPARLYAPIRQDAVLLPAGQNSQAARQLLAYLKTNEARQIISTYGYALP